MQRTHEFGRFQDIFEDTQAKVKKLAQMFGEEMVESTGNILRQRDEAQRGNP